MPKIVQKISDRNQLIIDVIVSPISIKDINHSDLSKYSFRGLVDTGASNSTISKEIVNVLDLKPLGKAPLISASEKTIANVYSVYIAIPKSEISGFAFDENDESLNLEQHLHLLESHCMVYELPKHDASFDVLIGMNILRRCVLVVEGEQFILSF